MHPMHCMHCLNCNCVHSVQLSINVEGHRFVHSKGDEERKQAGAKMCQALFKLLSTSLTFLNYKFICGSLSKSKFSILQCLELDNLFEFGGLFIFLVVELILVS